MGCTTNTVVGSKLYVGTATTSCTWQFSCYNLFPGEIPPEDRTITVTCYGTKTGRPWSQTTTITTTCCDENSPCAGTNCSTSVGTITTYGIDWGVCQLEGRTNCCPDGTIVTAPFYQPT